MASAVSSLPQAQLGQQQGGLGNGSQEAATSSSSSPSGSSIGPFFAVVSVLTFLTIVSCVLGRICFRRRAAGPVTPLDTIKHGGCLGWLRRKCRHCLAGEVEVGAKVMCYGEENNNDTRPHPLQV